MRICNGFHQFLYKLAKTKFKNLQIIIIDKEFKKPEKIEIKINQRYMEPKSQKHSPLIDYYKIEDPKI